MIATRDAALAEGEEVGRVKEENRAHVIENQKRRLQ